jgi:Flp pilus assembly protein TadG
MAAEVALALPLFLIFLFGIIDAGRFMHVWNRAQKATQAGARLAAATDMIPQGLASYTFTESGVAVGDAIPRSAFGGATCTSTGCTCMTGETCPALGTASATAFNRIVARMQAIWPAVQETNVVVDYGYSGMGYAGDPYGPDVAPLITVRLTGMSFEPATTWIIGQTIALPGFATTVSMEDGTGGFSN